MFLHDGMDCLMPYKNVLLFKTTEFSTFCNPIAERLKEIGWFVTNDIIEKYCA
jgi:hypothetical protein